MPTPHTIRYEVVRLDHLMIDRRVQRKEGTDQRRVDEIAARYNSGAAGTGTISRRQNGDLVIIDGAHRVAAAIKVGRQTIGAMVHDGLTLAQEAALFVQLNTFKQPSYISRTLAAVVQGDAAAMEIVSIIEAFGWKITAQSDPGNFAAIQAAERVYTSGVGVLPKGAHTTVLYKTIATITNAWHHNRDSVHQLMVQAVGQIFARLGNSVDQSRLTTVLSKELPATLIARARTLQKAQGGTTIAALAKIIVSTYNNRLRSNLLPEWVWTR